MEKTKESQQNGQYTCLQLLEFYYSIICEAIRGIVAPRVCNGCC